MSIQNPVKGERQRGPDLEAAGLPGNFSKTHWYIYGVCECEDGKWVQYRGTSQASPDKHGNRECNRCRIDRQKKTGYFPDSKNHTPHGANPARVTPKRGFSG